MGARVVPRLFSQQEYRMNRYLRMVLGILGVVSLMAVGLVATQVEAKGESVSIQVVQSTEVRDAEKPELVEFENGVIAMVVGSGDCGGDPERENGCSCTGYYWDPLNNQGHYYTYWVDCEPSPIIGCKDCCIGGLQEIALDPGSF